MAEGAGIALVAHTLLVVATPHHTVGIIVVEAARAVAAALCATKEPARNHL